MMIIKGVMMMTMLTGELGHQAFLDTDPPFLSIAQRGGGGGKKRLKEVMER